MLATIERPRPLPSTLEPAALWKGSKTSPSRSSADAGAVISDFECRFAVGRGDRDVDRAADRRVADGVLQEVTDQDAQVLGLDHHEAGIAAGETDVLPAIVRDRQQFGYRGSDLITDIDRADARGCLALPASSQTQQLTCELYRPLDPAIELVDPWPHFLIRRDLSQVSHLKLQGSKRGAQRVGCVRDKASLCAESILQALQRVVHGSDEGLHLGPGRSPLEIGRRSNSCRLASSRARPSSPPSTRLTTSESTSHDRGTRTAIGRSPRQAASLAISSLTTRCCDTCTVPL